MWGNSAASPQLDDDLDVFVESFQTFLHGA